MSFIDAESEESDTVVAITMPGGWIDRDEYAKKRYAEIAQVRIYDPDKARVMEDELKCELESPADIDNLPEVVKVENQKCDNCGHFGEYERFCWNCPVVIIKGRGNWVPKDDAIEGQK